MVEFQISDPPPTGAMNLPNAFTPMAFLTPELAYQTVVATYVLVGAVAVCDMTYTPWFNN